MAAAAFLNKLISDHNMQRIAVRRRPTVGNPEAGLMECECVSGVSVVKNKGVDQSRCGAETLAMVN